MRYVYGQGAKGGRLRAHILREDGGRTKSAQGGADAQGKSYRALCSGTFGVGPTDIPQGPVCEKCETVRAGWIEDAQEVLRLYVGSARPKIAWCSACGTEIHRKHVRETNYCEAPECRREQQRRNQAAWRAKSD